MCWGQRRSLEPTARVKPDKEPVRDVLGVQENTMQGNRGKATVTCRRGTTAHSEGPGGLEGMKRRT